jgi:hypothetical protein
LVVAGLNAISTSHVPLAGIEPSQLSLTSTKGADTTTLVIVIEAELD